MALVVTYLMGVLLVAAVASLAWNNPTGAATMLLWLSAFLEFVVNKSMPAMTGYANPVIMAALVAAFTVVWAKRGKTLMSVVREHKLITAAIVSVLFLVALSLFRGISPAHYLTGFRRDFQSVLLFVLLAASYPALSKEQFLKSLQLLLAVQVLIGALQFVWPQSAGIFFADRTPYEWGGELVVPIEQTLAERGWVTGTLGRFNSYGNFVAAVSCYLFAEIFLGPRTAALRNRWTYLLLFLSALLVLLSGNRMSLVSLLVGVFVILFAKRPRYAIGAAVAALVLFLSYGEVVRQLGVEGIMAGVEVNPLQRIGFLALVFGGGLDQDILLASTAGLSYSLVPQILQHPLFGAGEFWRGGYELIDPFTNNSTDATLALMLAEYGFVGSILYLQVLLRPLGRCMKHSRRDAIVPVLVLLSMLTVQTITDAGFFHRMSSLLFWSLLAFGAVAKTNPETEGTALRAQQQERAA